MKKTTQKLLSAVLVVIMLLTAMPLVFAEGKTYKTGDIIQFGSYPQTEVKDEVLIAELNALAPEWDDWTSYEYYSGNGTEGSMVAGNWMRYTDVIYNGNKYRGVRFTKYRENSTYFSQDSVPQIKNNYYKDTSYWFEFEAIDWRILDPDTGLIMSETIIDSQAYSNTIYYSNYEYFNDSLCENYANDYKTSSIRQWLNDDFYNTAFSNIEKKEINSTTLNNAGMSTLAGWTGYEKYDSKPTNDKIFLLSWDEVQNSNFGFSSEGRDNDVARIAYGSDYAKSQGLYVYNSKSNWLLRSPGNPISYFCSVVASSGSSHTAQFQTFYIYSGVRPALCLRDIYNYKHQHSYSSVITAPTCTTQGFTTYTCECDDTYVADYTNIVDHKDNNGDYKCDYDCGYKFEKPAPTDPSENCDCNCHKGGISGFFFKILNFFQKLFGMNKICACGVKH